MKKILTIAIALFAMLPASFAQEAGRAMPENGDIRVGLSWGWAWSINFDGRPHSKPILPIGAYADYTFTTFADGKGSLAGGAMFEFCRYQTWSTDKEIATIGFKTTHTWTQGILAATATVRYCFGQDFEVYARGFLGKDLQLGYDEEYSDESYAAIIPHTSGPGNTGASGLQLGIGEMVTDKTSISIQLGLGSYTTLGFLLAYKF